MHSHVGEVMHLQIDFEHCLRGTDPRWIVRCNPGVGFASKYTYLSSLRKHGWRACDWCRLKIADLLWIAENVTLTNRWLWVSYQTCCMGFVRAGVVSKSKRLYTTDLQHPALKLPLPLTVSKASHMMSVWASGCGLASTVVLGNASLAANESQSCLGRPL